jgi:hypothetical protein
VVASDAVSLVDGDAAAFHRVQEAAAERDRKYTERVVGAPVRREADRAWNRHDYAEAARLYESIETELEPTEQRRLNYARTRTK